jgi:outer membrane protein
MRVFDKQLRVLKKPTRWEDHMRFRRYILVACGLTLLGPPPAQAANLLQVYEQALQNDPQIREADATRLANRESKPQALARLLPQIDATGGYSWGDSEQGSASLINSIPTDPTSPLVLRATRVNFDTDNKSYQLQLRQSVFSWDRWSALKRADSQVAQAEADFQAAQQDLIARTAQRYFEVLAAKDTVDAAQATLEAFQRQLEQAEKRFEVGLIAITDVQETRARHDQATAAVIQAKRLLATAQEQLRELTGEPFETLASPIDDLPLKNPDPIDEERWVAQALEQNLRVISARLATDIAKQDINVVRSGYLPTIDLVATRADSEQIGKQIGSNFFGTSPPVPADRNQFSDSVGFQVSWAIYSGGATNSQVRQRVYLHRAARERLERANRETERQTRDAYLSVLSEISRVRALRQAQESTRTALQATEAGFEVGTRTTVDVLDARRLLFDAQTNYSRSRYDYIINVLRLQLATGTLNKADLEEINGWLKN